MHGQGCSYKQYRGIFVNIFCLITVSISVSDKATDILPCWILKEYDMNNFCYKFGGFKANNNKKFNFEFEVRIKPVKIYLTLLLVLQRDQMRERGATVQCVHQLMHDDHCVSFSYRSF